MKQTSCGRPSQWLPNSDISTFPIILLHSKVIRTCGKGSNIFNTKHDSFSFNNGPNSIFRSITGKVFFFFKYPSRWNGDVSTCVKTFLCETSGRCRMLSDTSRYPRTKTGFVLDSKTVMMTVFQRFTVHTLLQCDSLHGPFSPGQWPSKLRLCLVQGSWYRLCRATWLRPERSPHLGQAFWPLTIRSIAAGIHGC